jgi:hypothetical protein
MKIVPPHHIGSEEKLESAIHAAGHATLAYVHKSRGAALIRRDSLGNVCTERWHAYFVYMGIGRCRPAVYVAGAVAVEVDENQDVTPSQVRLTELEYTPDDVRRIPEGRNEQLEAIEEAMAVLRNEKGLFDEIVERLLEFENVYFRHEHLGAPSLYSTGPDHHPR